MAITTSLLPTTVDAVDASLRAEAERSEMYQGFADNDYAGRNAFLLMLAEKKLAEAHAEYLRLTRKLADANAELDAHQKAGGY
jgi:hypothetical protein